MTVVVDSELIVRDPKAGDFLRSIRETNLNLDIRKLPMLGRLEFIYLLLLFFFYFFFFSFSSFLSFENDFLFYLKYSIIWTRKLKVNGDAEPPIFENREEEYVLIRREIKFYTDRILVENARQPLATFVQEIQNCYPKKTILFVIEGLKDYLRGRKLEIDRAFKDSVVNGKENEARYKVYDRKKKKK